MFFGGLPYTIMSSIIDSQSSLFSNKSLIRYWKLSGADVFPNASRLKQNLPNGVINVVNLALSGCKGICQSPLDVSSLEKYRVPASLGAISSKVGSTSIESFTALFSLLRSTQILSLPLLFCTDTLGAHHSFGSVTLSIIPVSSIRLSYSSIFGFKGKAVLLTVLMQYGWAFSCSCILTGSHLNKPISPNNSASGSTEIDHGLTF